LAREKGLHSALATAANPVVEWKEKIIKSQSATLAIEFILKAQSDYTQYKIIVGKQETGKTTLVCHVEHQLDDILYVNIGPNHVSDKTFGEAVAKSFH